MPVVVRLTLYLFQASLLRCIGYRVTISLFQRVLWRKVRAKSRNPVSKPPIKCPQVLLLKRIWATFGYTEDGANVEKSTSHYGTNRVGYLKNNYSVRSEHVMNTLK